ncbi:MAG: M48 family metalloprotease [Pseudomonadota bacterium]
MLRKLQVGMIGVWVASCSGSVSTLKHDSGKPVRSALKSNWVELSKEQFLTIVLKTNSQSALDSTNPMTQKLQVWTDKFDAHLRSVDPVGMKNIPKPNVVILNSKEANAFVSSTPVCYDIATSVGGGGSSVSAILFNKGKETPIALSEGEGGLLSRCLPGDLSDLADIIKEYEASAPGCRVTLSPSKIEFGSGCKGIRENGSPIASMSANKLVLFEIPNWFVVLAPILDMMKEESSMVGVLAHELGHYYRSHSLALPGQYDFYYKINPNGNVASKPKAESNLEKMGNIAFNASQLFQMTSKIPKGEGYEVSPFHYLALGDIALQAQSKGLDSSACRELASYNSNVEKASKLKSLPFSSVKDVEDYKVVVQLGRDCMRDVDASKVSIDLEKAYSNPSFMPFKIVPELAESKTAIPSLLKGVASIGFVAKNVKFASKSLTEKVLVDMEAANVSVDQEIRQILAGAYKTGLGQYTIEQEADDFSVELLQGTQVGGAAAVTAYLNLLPETTRFGGFDLSRERCQEIYTNNWVDPKGEFQVDLMPIGNYSEVHHGTCYRVYNADREITAHGYSAKGSVSFSASEWSDLKQRVTSDIPRLGVFERGAGFSLGQDSCPFEQPRY